MEHNHHHDDEEMETSAFLRYMIAHNESHIKELQDAMNAVKDSDKEAYEKAMSAIQDFEAGNEKLKASLVMLKK